MTGYVRVEEQVEKDFDRARLKASLRRWRDWVRKDSAHDHLLSFEEAKGALVQWSQAYRGMRTVEVEKITGSVGRCQDFDGSFLPLKKSMGERWGRIDRAYHRGDELPAVSLFIDRGGVLRAGRQPPRFRGQVPWGRGDRRRGSGA